MNHFSFLGRYDGPTIKRYFGKIGLCPDGVSKGHKEEERQQRSGRGRRIASGRSNVSSRSHAQEVMGTVGHGSARVGSARISARSTRSARGGIELHIKMQPPRSPDFLAGLILRYF